MAVLWLIGMMGSGKSTVGRLVAKRNGLEHVDVDHVIEADAGSTVAEIFDRDGESAFRSHESAAISSLTGNEVVSTGGGAVLAPENVAHMRATGVIVYLSASIPTLVNRVGDASSRPLLSGGDTSEALTAIWEQRGAAYESAADFMIDADQDLADVVAQVAGCARYDAAPDASVLIGPQLPRRLLPERRNRDQAVVMCQPGSSRIANAVMSRLEREVDAIALVELPDGEAAKSIGAVGEVYETLAQLNVGRHDTIVGVGGGTVTDVSGFVAATWLRGIESACVPTTLLGAVDAAIGGKTGINVAGKNLVGAFWHPTRVSISLGILDGLPEDLRREGAAEAIKVGFIDDPVIVDMYREYGLDAPSGQVVRRAVAVKAAIVAEDFTEQGRRALLNFGHTVGHGIEVVLGIPHGHAVSIGMVAAAAVSARRHGFDPEKVVQPLRALGLPLDAAGADRDAVLEYVSRDKKRTADGIRMVLLKDVGEPTVEVVSNEDLQAGLDAIGVG